MCVSGRFVRSLHSGIQYGLSQNGLPGLANTGWLSMNIFPPSFFYRVQRLYEAETGSRICLEPDALGNEPSDNFFFNFRIRCPGSSGAADIWAPSFSLNLCLSSGLV